MLHDLQDRFAGALFQELSAPLDQALAGDLGSADSGRLAVYRNTVQGSLIGVLRAAFPMTETMAGRDNFAFAARRFVSARPPREARLLTYGVEFPAWLAAFGPAKPQPWLAELARLEWACNEALFAADAEPLAPERLTALSADAVGELGFVMHPSVRLVRSDFAIDRLWRVLHEGRPAPDPRAAAETVLVLRPDLQVVRLLLGKGEAVLIEHLLSGATLALAAEAALVAEPGLDLQAVLFRHLRERSFCDLRYTATVPDAGDRGLE